MSSSERNVSALATCGAVASCIGLFFGNILGLILAILAVRQLDRSTDSLFGYRLALTGWVVGIVGIILYPLFYYQFQQTSAGDFQRVLVLTLMVTAWGIFPFFMLCFAWQDRLAQPQNEHGFGFLGKTSEAHAIDKFGCAIGLAISALLIVSGIVGKRSSEGVDLRSIEHNIWIIFGVIYLISTIFLSLRRRGSRTAWLFFTTVLLVGTLLKFALK